MKLKFSTLNLIRLDHFLVKELNDVTRTKIQKLIIAGKIKVNNKIILKTNFKIKGSGIIEIVDFIEEKIELEPWYNSNLLNIIEETNDYLVISKPPNLSVHPGKGNLNKTLVNILIAEGKKLSWVDLRPGIVHRLDKNTSGLMIIAKTKKFHNFISDQFQNNQIEKVYIGLVQGHMPATKGMIDAPIARDIKNRTKMTVSHRNGKEAITTFRVLERFEENDLVEFKILTGRTHQIRVHCKYVGAPIYNDPEYGKKNSENGQFLHSKIISFVDLEKKVKTFSLEIPKYMEMKLNELRKV